MARILVVDDDADVRSLVVRRLSNAGHRVQGASGAGAAEELVESKGVPDIVVLDVGMAPVDGLELLTRLRTQTGSSDLAAIFLSGKMRPEDIAAGRELGAIYLTKPFIANALLGAVQKILDAQEQAKRDAEGTNEW